MPNLIETILLFFILGLWSCCSLWLMILYSKCANLYIQNKADSRTLSLFSFSIIMFISMLWFFILVFEGRVIIQASLLPKFLFLVFIMQNLKSRMIGFPSVKFDKKSKMRIYMLTDAVLFLVVCITAYSINHQSNYSYELTLSLFLQASHYFLSTTFSDINLFVSYLFVFISIIAALLIIIFDVVENRSKKTSAYNIIAFFLPLLFQIVYDFVSYSPTRIMIVNLSNMITIICISMYMYKEYKSILRRANGVDANVRAINEAIADLSKRGYTDDAPIVRIVLDILSTNTSTRNIVLNKKYFGSKRNNTISYFKERLKEGYGIATP